MPISGVLNLEDKQRNKRIATDRIIVENYFGRLVNLWSILGRRFRLDEYSFDVIISLCTTLTNIHISFHPLSAEEADEFVLFTRNVIMTGGNRQRNRRNMQRTYRGNRRARINDDIDDEDAINGLLEGYGDQ